MEEFQNNSNSDKQEFTEIGDISVTTGDFRDSSGRSNGSSVQTSDFEDALNQAFDTSESDLDSNSGSRSSSNTDHNHAKPENAGNPSLHTSLNNVASARTLNADSITVERSLTEDVGNKGDFLNPGGGRNTVIGSGDADIIDGTGGGFNTITTGGGRDTILLGRETTNRIFDFDPTQDQLVFSGIDLNNIVIGQGTNPDKGGLDQPLDSENNTLVIDKSTDHILAALTFVKSSAIGDSVLRQLAPEALGTLDNVSFDNVQEGNGQLTGTQKSDKLVGGGGDDFLYVGDDGFKIGKAKGSGPGEFPFPNDSPGTSDATAELEGGVLRISGRYKNFDGAPLFSQGETEIDPNATILNGSDPEALIEGFLRVPQDDEGNRISGTHLHFSPAQDSRGNFADATVIRYLEEDLIDAKSGTISGEFELTPEEQAAFLAGNLYVNLHTNIDLDGDGRAGFPTGENRLNFNQDVVRLA